ALLLEDPGGEPLESLLGAPMELGQFLRLGIGAAAALGKLHQRGLVHREIKPANMFVQEGGKEVRLTGFGIASRLPRERQSPEPPESIAGTLAYMAPEQTGRMNRSIDSRSDLYALGVTLYEAVTGSLPFTASEPMEWVHCHIARNAPAPCERIPRLPSVVSALIMKLLAKNAEERYQTALGLEHDPALPGAVGSAPQHRELSTRRARHAGPAAGAGNAVRPRERDRSTTGVVAAGRGVRHPGTRACLWIRRHRE